MRIGVLTIIVLGEATLIISSWLCLSRMIVSIVISSIIIICIVGGVILWNQCNFGCCITLDLALWARMSGENSLEVIVSAHPAALRHCEVMVIDIPEVEV